MARSGYERIGNDRYALYARRDLFEQFQQFRVHTEFKQGETRGVAGWDKVIE
jgi:hypothetical protein